MLTTTLAAVISLVTSLIVTIITQYWNTKFKQKEQEREERKKLNFSYSNPLRFALERAYFRLSKLLKLSKERNAEFKKKMPTISNVSEVSSKDEEWFTFDESGYYIISSCYMTACLFYQIEKMRSEVPYLSLDKKDDARIIALMYEVTHSFATEGVYHVVQDSIGIDMYMPEEKRLMSYREFCQLLKVPDKRKWFDQLISFYIGVGLGEKSKQVQQTVDAIDQLLNFIEISLNKGTPAKERQRPFK
ncbi:MAG: hypothetical protein F6J95_013265 [Leptolyngbya sp. SIO1E4]|nr:hypothetical protein [Leptolyngbya sp. SIO1E4]